MFKRFFVAGCLRKNFVLNKPEVSSRQKKKQLSEDDSQYPPERSYLQNKNNFISALKTI